MQTPAQGALTGLGEQCQIRKAIEFYNGDTMCIGTVCSLWTMNGAKKSAVVQFNDIQSPVDGVIGFHGAESPEGCFAAQGHRRQEQQTYSRAMNDIRWLRERNKRTDQVETDQDADMMINRYRANRDGHF